MAKVNIYVHLVWGTKYRKPVLIKPQRYELYDFLMAYAIERDIKLEAINGWTDHMHCLIKMKADHSIAHIAQMLKGGSAYWLNQKAKNLFPHKIRWAKSYYAASIHEQGASRVAEYIRNQEAQHRKQSFQEECQEFLDGYDFDADEE